MQVGSTEFYINCFVTFNLLLQIVTLTLVSYIAASIDEIIITKAKFDDMISQKLEEIIKKTTNDLNKTKDDYSDMPKLVEFENLPKLETSDESESEISAEECSSESDEEMKNN